MWPIFTQHLSRVMYQSLPELQFADQENIHNFWVIFEDSIKAKTLKHWSNVFKFQSISILGIRNNKLQETA